MGAAAWTPPSNYICGQSKRDTSDSRRPRAWDLSKLLLQPGGSAQCLVPKATQPGKPRQVGTYAHTYALWS